SLAKLYERQGREDKLAELMERQLSMSRSQQDKASMLALSLRLGAIFARERPGQAIEGFRSALEGDPQNPDVVGRLLAPYEGDDRADDRAELLERMLKLSSGREAAERALALADLRGRLGDEDGAARALEIGFRADPTVGAVRDRLAALYTSTE